MMTRKSQPRCRDHVRGKLPNISYFTVFLSWYASKHFKTVGKWWGILKWGLLHVITRCIAKMVYESSFTKLHSQKKKKCYFPTFLRGEISLFYRYSNFWVLQENREQFLNWVFAHCYQEHRQNEIHFKVHLSTLFTKRNTNFHGVFLLRLSVCLIRKKIGFGHLPYDMMRQVDMG